MNLPTLDRRLAVRQRPPGRPVMRQRWSRLLFLHWRVAPESLRPLLPPGLHLDLHDGSAWLGIVPFFMERIRPAGLPPLPGLSWFLELNVRTYVHDDSGDPGVWFLSLDCNQPLAVILARTFFFLPYRHARMSASGSSADTAYRCLRRGEGEETVFRYGPRDATRSAEPGSLEFFLLERYALFSARRGRLHRGLVHHPPYRWAQASCDTWSALPLKWNGLPEPRRDPDSALWADSVDVDIFPLQPIPERINFTPQSK